MFFRIHSTKPSKTRNEYIAINLSPSEKSISAVLMVMVYKLEWEIFYRSILARFKTEN